MKFTVSAAAAVMAMFTAAFPAIGSPVQFRATGVVTGFEYNAAAAAGIFAVAPVGTAYLLDFGYDTWATPLYGNANYAAYGAIPVDAVFTFAGYSASFPVLNVTVGDIGMGSGDQFQLFGNAAYSSTQRLAGYQLLDLSLRITDPTSTAFASPALPSTFDLADFVSRTMVARFAFGAAGETRLSFSVDAISPLTAAVPEPRGWVMMIAGFACVGISLRRRRYSRDFQSA